MPFKQVAAESLRRDLVIRVLVVDDHAFVRACLKALLGGEEDISVVGECSDGADVVSAVAATSVDVVLMDIRMPRLSGIDAARALTTADPSARVVLMTSRIMSGDVARAADAGASGFLLKGGEPGDLVAAVRTVAAGGTAWPGRPVAA